jgi:flagellar FliL protein
MKKDRWKMPEEAVLDREQAVEEKIEEGPESPTPEKVKSPGGLKKILILLAGIQVLMAAGAFVFLNMYVKPRIRAADEEPAVVEKDERGQIHLIEDILVNPAGTNGTRYLSTSIGLETSDFGHETDGFEKLTPVIRDIFIAILSSRTLEELGSIDGKEKLRNEILVQVNEAIKPDSVYRVYFVDYVLQ